MNRHANWIAVLWVAIGSAATAAEKPNLLFIAIDDMRPKIGCYGGPQVKSPRLDRLAASALRFDRAYCQVPVCGASRASLMTGVLPTPKRFTNFDTRVDEDASWAVTLPEAFRMAGYTTLSNGKIFHHRDDTGKRSWSEPAWRPKVGPLDALDPATTRMLSSRGRGRIYEAPDVADDAYPDGLIAARTIRDLRRLKEAGGPFLLACGFMKPHMPFYAPKKYWDLYQRDGIEIADNRFRPKNAPSDLRGSGEFRSYHRGDIEVGSEAWHRMMRHGYYACVSYVDAQVGKVLDELESLGLADNTIVVVWGDHGWHLGEHDFWGKHNTMELALRVPLLMRVPGKKPGVSGTLVETSDLFPTLCELAGIPIPETVQGRSFTQLLDQPDADFRDSIYTRFKNGDAIVTKRYAFTSYRRGKAEMLYDHRSDPAENVNVSGEAGRQPVLDRMRHLLRERMHQAEQAGR